MSRRPVRYFGIALVLPLAVSAADAPRWPDTFVARVEALALIQTLNADILASRSATRSLEKWCGDHALAAEPKIRAMRIGKEDKPPSQEQRKRLQVSANEAVKYRHVQLRCGEHVLSDAENWYVPGRLSAAMNQALDSGDTPFGKVIEPLHPYRVTFATQSLWSPLPEGWETSTLKSESKSDHLAIPAALFEHDALLYSAEHQPFSEVKEVYQGEILAFPPPGRR